MSSSSPLPDDILAARLVAWLPGVARDLPWRKDRTGYRVWVSEVMLQQTRVATVIPYFERFVRRFPTVRALAEADVSDVLALWSGLGYYRRARALHAGAVDVVALFGGELPRTVPELLRISGIGAYTAGAIASLAHGVRAPLVDGNVVRVLSRLFCIEDDMSRGPAQKRIWALAERLVPADAPGPFNEALMELGATVCTPREPRCDACPLADACVARARGLSRDLPRSAKAKAVPEIHVAALVARDGDRVLLGRRRGDALFGGMWEPPMVEAEDGQAALRGSSDFAAGATASGTVTHVLSHRKMTIQVLVGRPKRGAAYPPVYEEVRFVRERDLSSYGISTLARKVMQKAGGQGT